MTTFRTSETPIENLNMSPGDTLVVDTRVKFGGMHKFPEGVKVIGEEGGGFDIVAEKDDRQPPFIFLANTKVENVSFDILNTPQTGITHANPKLWVDYTGKPCAMVSGDDVAIENCSFSGNTGIQLNVLNSKNLEINECLFTGGMYQIRLTGATDDAQITKSKFCNALGDGIKTERSKGFGPQRALVEDCLFHKMNRDGIDTAGGFSGGRVVDCVFWECKVCALDFKKILELDTDMELATNVQDVSVENAYIYKSINAIVLTALDRKRGGKYLDLNNHDTLVPHGINITGTMRNCNQGFLFKAGHSVTWDIKAISTPSQKRVIQGTLVKASHGLEGKWNEATDDRASLESLWNYPVGPVDHYDAPDELPELIDEPDVAPEPIAEPEPELEKVPVMLTPEMVNALREALS